MPSFIFSTRTVQNGSFVAGYNQPDPTRYLVIADNAPYDPSASIPQAQWVQQVQQAAMATAQPVLGAGGESWGAILVFVHGYNNGPSDVIARHRQLQADLTQLGWNGIVVSYDWPSDDSTLGYLDDRGYAKATAGMLVQDGISILAQNQTQGCKTTVHLLGHSMGAYLIREACDGADDNRTLTQSLAPWSIGQCVFISADISSNSLATSASDSIYLHAGRVTNYSNGCDEVLAISNVKRFGVAPRAGRVGLPSGAPPEAVNVDCTAYYKTLNEANRRLNVGVFCHSWYFGDLEFTKDLAETLQGGLDSAALPTRSFVTTNRFQLV